MDDNGFPVECDTVGFGMVGVEDGGLTVVMDVELELTFVVVE